jgi:hypothetical protein
MSASPPLGLVHRPAEQWISAEEAIRRTGWTDRWLRQQATTGDVISRETDQVTSNGRRVREFLLSSLPQGAAAPEPAKVSMMAPLGPLFADLPASSIYPVFLADPEAEPAWNASWCTYTTNGTTSTTVCNFDDYVTPGVAGALVIAGPQGPIGATGATGATGPTGAAGATPNIVIGTISTGTAAATLTGTAPNYTLNFTLPSFATNAAYNWTALETFSSGIAASAATINGLLSVPLASSGSSAAWPNFGGSQQSASALNGGWTLDDNGSSRSYGGTLWVGSVLNDGFHTSGSNIPGVAIYGHNTTGQGNVYIDPETDGAYISALSSFAPSYAFTPTAFVSKLPIWAQGAAVPLSSAGFSNFGGELNSCTNLGGGITTRDNGSTYSFGLATMCFSLGGSNYGGLSVSGIGLYSNQGSSGGQGNIYMAPSEDGVYPTALSGFDPTAAFTPTMLFLTTPIKIGSLSSGAQTLTSAIQWSDLGGSTHSGSLYGGMTVYNNLTSAVAAVAELEPVGTGDAIGLGLYDNEGSSPAGGRVFVIPAPTSAAYPTANTSFENLETDTFTPTAAVLTGNIMTTPPTQPAYSSIASPSAILVGYPYDTQGGSIEGSDPQPVTSVWGNASSSTAYTNVGGGGDVLTPKGYVDRDVMVNGHLPPKYALPLTGIPYTAQGDSNTSGLGVTCNLTDTYGDTCYVMDNYIATGASSVTNNGVGGDESCDMAAHVFNEDNPSTSRAAYSGLIGTNDVHYSGLAYLPNATLCESAAIMQMATQLPDRVAGSTFTSGTGTWTNYTTFSVATGTQTTTASNTTVATITTHGGPIYVAYPLIDGNSAGFTWQLDSGATSATVCNYALSCATGQPAISTHNGTTVAPGVLRIPPPAPGTHTITFTSVGTVNGFVSGHGFSRAAKSRNFQGL